MFYFSNKIAVTTKFEQFCFKNFVVDIYSFQILISRQTTDKHRNINFINMSTYILRTKNSISLFFYTVQISYQYHKVQIPYLGLRYSTWGSDTLTRVQLPCLGLRYPAKGSDTLPSVQLPYLGLRYPTWEFRYSTQVSATLSRVQILYQGCSYSTKGADTLPRVQIPYPVVQISYLGFRYSV